MVKVIDDAASWATPFEQIPESRRYAFDVSGRVRGQLQMLTDTVKSPVANWFKCAREPQSQFRDVK